MRQLLGAGAQQSCDLLLAPACRELAQEADLAAKRAYAKAAYDADPEAKRRQVAQSRADRSPEALAATKATRLRWVERNRVTRECPHCGITFAASPNHPEAVYCSPRCAVRARHGVAASAPTKRRYRDLPESERGGTCAHCQAGYIRSHPRQEFCSQTCSSRAQDLRRAQARRDATPSWVAGICPRCGRPFIDRWQAEHSSRYCSLRCGRAAVRDRRRARKRKAFIALVSRHAIFQRDKWTCHLCGKRVKRSEQAHHIRSPRRSTTSSLWL